MKTLEEKYNFLLDHLRIKNIDFWEKDAILDIDPLYFQFNKDEVKNVDSGDVDWAVEQALLESESAKRELNNKKE